MTSSIYVAGASTEIQRAAGWIAKLTQEGFRVTYDWTKAVGEFGSYGEELRDHERRMYARSDLRGVTEANIFWLLAPVGATTVGAWIEMGFALALVDNTKRCIVVSPPVSEKVIFATLPAVLEFETDEAAFEQICRRVA